MGRTVILFRVWALHIHFCVVTRSVPTSVCKRNQRRPSYYDSESALALVLHHLSSTMDDAELLVLFGGTPSSTSRTKRKSLAILLQIVTAANECRIQWPNTTEMEKFSRMIRSKYRWLNGCIGVMDGTVLKIRQSVVPQIQEHWYSGHHGFHCCNNILVFAPDGTIIAADLNWPGSKHDAFCSWRIYQIIVGEFLPQPYFLIADSAFPHSGQSVNLKVVTT